MNHELLEVLLEQEVRAGRLAGGAWARTARATTSTPTRRPPRSPSRSRAEKLIYLTDVPGILENGELVSEIRRRRAARARSKTASSRAAWCAKAKSVLRAIEGGVASVHILDGRTPHSVIAELFTDRGVGTLVRKD